ncbi:SphA family protein [Paraburkholderia ferrariae]|uniref:SphA family protein n=1 Tax=Paraburkholderia ferrariae TaxID=386056 RepID=UPI0004884143|nr:transporter [Paraburkholderia ferrariae]
MRRPLRNWGLAASKLLVALAASAQFDAHAVLPTVTLPSGLDLGSTSFLDGFGGSPGDLAVQSYFTITHANAYKTSNGANSPLFNDPQLNVQTLVEQVLYELPTATTIFGGHPGIDVILPLVNMNPSFTPPPPYPGVTPTTSHAGLGDMNLGVLLQWDPVMVDGHPVFVSRAEVYGALPTGRYDPSADLNPGNHFWGVGITGSFTFLLGPNFEISLRPHYQYSFKNGEPASSAPLDPGIEDTQAGQVFYTNFAASYKVTDKLRIGINGYYLRQLTDNRINGASVPDSREQVLGIGPGLFYDLRKSDKFWLNTYTETLVRNRFRNSAVVNLRWIHMF